MSQEREAFAADALEEVSYDEVPTQGLVAVRSCGRIGLVANPPSFSLTDWFRTTRWRRPNRVSAA